MLFYQQTMRKILTIFVPIFFLLAPSVCFAHPFEAGEELRYIIKLVGIPVGRQILQVKRAAKTNQGPLYVLSSEVESSGVGALFFPMKDKIKSYVNMRTLYPRLVKIDIQEGSRVENIEVRIDNENGSIKAFIRDKNRERKWIKQLSSSPLDMLSLIYWIRAQDLEVGKKFEILLLDTPGNFKKIQFEISSIEKAYTYLGIFPAFVCRQTGAEEEIRVWFSKDELHLPLYIQISTPLGFLTAVLQNVVQQSSTSLK